MKSRNILFTGPSVAALVEDEIGAPKANEVQVRLTMSTVSSGTERANLVGDPNVSMGTGNQVIWPRALGYSSCGVIEAIGSDVTDLKVGDRVAMAWTTHRELININHTDIYERAHVYPVSNKISDENAALFQIGTFPLAAIRKCGLEIGESAIVMGMGILGLFAIPLLKAAGAAPVIAVDPVPEKREKALASGADFAFDPYDPNFAKQVKEVTGGGANVGIEVTGVGAGLDGILDCMAPFGRVALLGCTRNKNFTIDYYGKVHCPGITLIGAHTMARPKFESSKGWWTQKDDIQALIKLTEMGRINLASLVDEIHSPAEAPDVYTRLANEKSFPIVQFDWRLL
ncbi:MAG: zinc-binding dehydrogenase [Lachnospiraceae bacterium]|nr:zinc-binding dehydrogenase [Lachnospiraceae bacterium]